MLTLTLSGPHGGHGGGHGGGHHGGGHHGGGHHHGGGGWRHGGGGWRRGGGWYPGYYNYGPEVVVVPPLNNCQFTIQMPTGEQIVVTGSCPVALTGPVKAMITPL